MLNMNTYPFYLKNIINAHEQYTKQKIKKQTEKSTSNIAKDKILQDTKTSIKNKERLIEYQNNQKLPRDGNLQIKVDKGSKQEISTLAGSSDNYQQKNLC